MSSMSSISKQDERGKKQGELEMSPMVVATESTHSGAAAADYLVAPPPRTTWKKWVVVSLVVCLIVAGLTGAVVYTQVQRHLKTDTDCAEWPCGNGGTCTDGVNTYKCACVAGYNGTNCENDVNECLSAPCRNGAECTDGIDAYNCTCVTGYTGDICEIDIDDCATYPCQNNGTCNDGINSYNCSCPDGYGGVTCEQALDDCNVSSHSRVDCGYPGIGRTRCIAKGCCFDNLTANVPWCFYSARTADLVNSGWFRESNGLWYKIFRNELNHNDAKANCSANGARLASTGIRNDTVISSIKNRMTTDHSSKQNIWIGLEKGDGNWVWSDGETSAENEIDWAPGEPSRVGSCGQMWATYSWKLDDTECFFAKYYLCEQ